MHNVMIFSNDFFKFVKEKEKNKQYQQLEIQLEIPPIQELEKNTKNNEEEKDEIIIVQIT